MPDPTAVRVVALRAAETVDAFVYTQENPGTAVLRVTPPYHGRMRARLHVYRGKRTEAGLHLEPEDLLLESVVATYPGTADRRAHEDWREAATEALRDTIAHPRAGRLEVAVLDG